MGKMGIVHRLILYLGSTTPAILTVTIISTTANAKTTTNNKATNTKTTNSCSEMLGSIWCLKTQNEFLSVCLKLQRH